MKAFLPIAGLALLVCGCATDDDAMAVDQTTTTMPPMAAPAVSDAARTFAMMSASSNMFEIESSRQALQRTSNPMVRQFAQQMISDHTALMNAMAPVAARLGLPPNPPMATHHADMLNRLQAAGTGAAFDAAYHQAQMMAHQEALALHQNYASNGDNPELRTLAAQAVPVIQQHLSHLQMHGDMQSNARRGERG